MPASVVSAARGNLSEGEKQLRDHLARIDNDLRTLEQERRAVARERATVADTEKKLKTREELVREREEGFRRRLDTKLDDQVREARKEIDRVIEGLKTRAAELSDHSRRAAARISTGDAGAARSEARNAIEEVVGRLKKAGPSPSTPGTSGTPGTQGTPEKPPVQLAPGVRVAVGTLGLEGFVIELHGKYAEVDVRGKRLRAALRDLRVIGEAPLTPKVNVHIDLQPREGMLSEINVIGCTVDEALTRLEKFLDQTAVTDLGGIQHAPHPRDHVRRGHAGWLVDDQPSVDRLAAAAAHYRSSSGCSPATSASLRPMRSA